MTKINPDELDTRIQGLKDALVAERDKRRRAERDRQVLLAHIKENGGFRTKVQLIADGVWRMPEFYPDGSVKSVGDEEKSYRPACFDLGGISTLEEALSVDVNPSDPFFIKELITLFGIDGACMVIEGIEGSSDLKKQFRKEEIESLILEGFSLAEIGRKFSVSRQRIHQLISELGIRKQELRDERDRRLLEEITRYAKDGYAIGDVAHTLSLPYSQVQKMASKGGVKFTAAR